MDINGNLSNNLKKMIINYLKNINYAGFFHTYK